MDAHLDTQASITLVCRELERMLLDKNRRYGDSALQPKRIFSKASATEQLLVRLDDKLSRLASAQADDLEDVVLDLLGYLVLLRVALKREASNRLNGPPTPATRTPTYPVLPGPPDYGV